MMPVPPRAISPEMLAEARRLYEQTRVPVDDIAAMLGIGARSFYTRLRKWDWKRRMLRIPQASPPALADSAPLPRTEPVADAPQPTAVVAPPVPVAERIQRAVERELHAVEQIVAKLRPSTDAGEAERAARVLASLARTLQEVARLDRVPAATEQAKEDDDRGPDDADDFIRGLARRMDEFARAAARSVPDADDAGRA
jgi:hypothetical protein